MMTSHRELQKRWQDCSVFGLLYHLRTRFSLMLHIEGTLMSKSKQHLCELSEKSWFQLYIFHRSDDTGLNLYLVFSWSYHVVKSCLPRRMVYLQCFSLLCPPHPLNISKSCQKEEVERYWRWQGTFEERKGRVDRSWLTWGLYSNLSQIYGSSSGPSCLWSWDSSRF